MSVVPLLGAGKDLGRYTVEALLGRGGMAAVYVVRHNDLGTLHALKVMLLPTAHLRERLLREGRAQGALRHPNIVAVTDTVTVNGSPGLVVELVDGPSLDEVLACRRLPLTAVDALAADILAGVGAAHAAGFVHRDLKPANVLVSIAGGKVAAKVADFGLVKAIWGAEEAGAARTRTGAALGTPAYMAPEQIRDASRVDARTDVFALGAILYELITGVRAFGGRDTLEVFNQVAEGRPTELDALRPDVPPRMRRAVEEALRKDPDDRPASVEDLWQIWSDGDELPGHAWDEAWLDRLSRLRTIDALPTAPSSTPRTFSSFDSSAHGLATTQPFPMSPREEEPLPSAEAPRRTAWLRWAAGVAALLLAVGAAGALSSAGPSLSHVPDPLTGTPRVYRLGGGEGPQLFPSLGPHGDVVVYSDGVDLFSRRVGATSSHLLTGSFEPHATEPSVSPDGGRIALSADGAVWVMGEQGEDPRELAPKGYWPSWSPDGRSIVYATGDEADIWVARQRASEVWVVDLTSGERRKVADYGVQPVFTPDGAGVASFDGDEVSVVRADGSGPIAKTVGPGVAHWHPVYDGPRLFTLSNHGEAMSLSTFDTTRSVPAEVMSLPTTWGFDVRGGRVVASTVDETFAILRVDLDDGERSVVASDGAPTCPAIGPDGRWAMVQYQSPERLVLIGAGGREQTLVQGGTFRAPRSRPTAAT
ncbi:MAG: serine/threonine-protein kinase [Alphaproteobacteria bacterium]|nr:serine/threonine-protein kinase [Alphaproteobacteria bacterium]